MIEYGQFALANGFRVVTIENHRAPLVAVDLIYHVGSKNESWGRTGFAHLFEHLMFEGSKHAPGKMFDHVLQNAGGENNAYTTEDLTNYYDILPSHQMELAFWLESDRMRFLNINQESLDLQRDVVMEERRQRVDNQPYGTAMENMSSRLYSQHPYRWPVIGHKDHLTAATLDDVQAFYQRFYAPDNATMIVAGDIDPERVADLVNRYFGDFTPSGNPKPGFKFDEPLSEDIREVFYDQIQLPAVFIGYRTVEETHADYLALDLLSDILTHGKSSRLYQKLVYNGRMAQSVVTFQEQNEHPGAFLIYAIARPGISLREIETAIDEEIAELVVKPVRDVELQKVKNLSVSALISRMQGIANQADFMSRYCGLYNNPEIVNLMIDQIQAVTPDDIRRVAGTWLQARHRVVLDYLPKSNS